MSTEETHHVCAASVLTLPELEQSKTTVLSTLVSAHSRRSYKHAIEKFIDWYCSEPRLGFNRPVVVQYRSFLERCSLSAATINLHLSAIRRLADEAAESSLLSAELAIGIRRVKGVKRLGRRIGNWLNADQAQELLNAVPQSTLRGKRDAAVTRAAARMWTATFRSRELAIRSTAIEGKPLGHRRYGRQGRTAANDTGAGLVYGVDRCLDSRLRCD